MTHYPPRNRRHQTKRRRLLLLGSFLLIGTMAAVAWWAQRPPIIVTTEAQQINKPIGPLSSRLLFVGDVFWGRQVQKKSEASDQGYAYITHGLSSVDRAAYDAWIANFECPITTRDVAYELQTTYLKFNCRPEYLQELAKWFTAVTLANNHTANNGGQQGLIETRQHLEQARIQYTGTYDMDQLDDLCEVISLPALRSGSAKAFKMPVALCGYMYVVDATPTDAQLEVMRAYSKVMPVIAMPHMGIEYRATAEAAKEAAYRRMIDHGADMVIGAHPHVIQNSENYHGRLVAYSVGNFLFDQQRFGRTTTLGLGVGVKLSIADRRAADIYQQVGSSCTAYKDACLQQLQARLAQRPKVQVSYSFACYDEAAGVPTLGDESTCQEAKVTATVDRLGTLSKQW